MLKVLPVLFILILVLSACGDNPTATTVPAPTATAPAATATTASILTPTPAQPTFTPAITTKAPTPTADFNATGMAAVSVAAKQTATAYEYATQTSLAKPSATPTVKPTPTVGAQGTLTAAAASIAAVDTQVANLAATTNAKASTPLKFSGTGDKVIKGVELFKGAVRVISVNTISGYFSVKVLNSAGDQIALAVSSVGNSYQGSTYIPVEDNGQYLFSVQSSGNWSLEIQPFNYIVNEKPEPGPVYKGRGDRATLVTIPKDGLVIFKFTHTGEAYFSVKVISPEDGTVSNLLASEIGKYSGEKPQKASAGDYLVNISADGDWTIEVTY
jgi:hypothetical protein